MALNQLIWARGNKCSILHILPKQAFVPAICGFESKANRGGTAKWGIFKTSKVSEILNSKHLAFDGYRLCPKCIKLAENKKLTLEKLTQE